MVIPVLTRLTRLRYYYFRYEVDLKFAWHIVIHFVLLFVADILEGAWKIQMIHVFVMMFSQIEMQCQWYHTWALS